LRVVTEDKNFALDEVQIRRWKGNLYSKVGCWTWKNLGCRGHGQLSKQFSPIPPLVIVLFSHIVLV